ncbi:MAG: hypothetical protein O3B67_00230 [archaeon]|nr:hypothetical protein [archaeon]
MGDLTRLFFRIGYLGDQFHGSQIQPDVKTVQGELQRVFTKLQWWDGNESESFLVLSSRTDAGVHVRMNGGIVTVQSSLWNSITPRKFVRAVDDLLDESLVFLDVYEVDEDWNPRMAKYRTYRYMLEGMDFWKEPEYNEFLKWLSIFKGTHNFTNFSKLELGKNPERNVLDVQPWMVDDRIVGFEITGESFLWNQVRRIANSLFQLSIGELQLEQVQSALLHPEKEEDFGVAPPEWLILWGIAWEGFDIPPESTHTDIVRAPSGKSVERTRKKRWQQGRQHQIKMMLYDEWATLGKFEYVAHARE